MVEDEKNQFENLLKLNLTPELLQLLTDTFPFLISYVDNNRTYRFHNKEYEKMFGLPYEEIHGKHVEDVLGKEAYELVKPYIDKALAGERVRFESLIPYKDGERFMDVQYLPHINNNEVVGFIAIVHYVSDRKKTASPDSKFDTRMNEIMSALVELTCLAEEVQLKLYEAETQLKKAEQINDKINDLLKKWTADLKASEAIILKVKAAIIEWINKNKPA